MLKSLKKTAFNLLISIITVICLVGISIFAVDFSTIFFVLIGGVLGLVVYFISLIKNRNKDKVKNPTENGGEK